MVVIIADDERLVRRGIVENIPWNSFGIDTIIETRNGTDCLEKAEVFHPDILIADIRMPKLNGIDLGREIASRYPKCKIIIISAYSEKEYLKSAISLNVIAYVEKPIIISELEAAIEKAVSKIKENGRINDENAAYQLYANLLSGAALSNTEKMLLRKLNRDTKNYSVALISSRESSLKYRELRERIEEEFDPEKTLFFIYQDILPHSYVLLIQDKGAEDFLDDLVGGLKTMICQMKGNFFISVGVISGSAEGITQSFAYAKAGNNLLFKKGYGTVAYVNNNIAAEEYSLEEDVRSRIVDDFANGQKRELLAGLHNLFDGIAGSSRNYDDRSIRHVFGKLLERFAEIERKGPLTELHIWERVLSCQTLDELRGLFDQLVDLSLPEDMVQNLIVKRMLLLITNEYSRQELSITYICEKLGVGRSKACSVFKEETGKTINEYITEYRMNKAKQYLYDDLPLEDVAKLVGYHDSSYFSKLFKKITGVTPASYRRQTWND